MTRRTLVLLRHAKAEHPNGYPQDIDRPLSSRGRADAAAAGRWLVEAGLVPELVLCSSAVRTRETWRSAAETVGEIPIVYEPRLYLAGVPDALDLIQETDASVSVLLVIGHNPTLSALSATLDPDGGDGLRTAGIAVHRLTGTWQVRSAPLTHSHTARA
jgi:phosphohistidine phosphatase